LADSPGTEPDAPLRGIRVLDLTRVLSGPYCTMMLADQGAEVIKVEIPGRGDDGRHVGPPFKGSESAFFISVNRNKKSLTLNLKSEQGLAILKKLAAKADVLVENYRPGVAERLGIDYASLAEVNPALVYCSISGFGQTGPYRERPGYNFTVQALSGVMTVSGEPGTPPYPVGISLGDIPAGMFAAFAITSALYARRRTGEGCYIDLSMLDALVAMMEYPVARFGMTGECPPPIGQFNPSITPFGVLGTADSPIVLAVGNDKLWKTLCETLGRPDLLADPRYETNRLRTENATALYAELRETLTKKPSREWLAVFIDQGIPAAHVNTVDDVFADPQVKARGMIQSVRQPEAGVVSIAGSPVRLGKEVQLTYRPAPRLGEHTDEVLRGWLGLSESTIHDLRGEGVV
jgi:crotonobetainyl-CoA:carnitine CoA-transferase CaiB-like acyl-CoA transferase